MKVILIGNIGAGKTTMAHLILEKYKQAHFLSIDNIRKQYGDGTKEKEAYCKDQFIHELKMDKQLQLIELTGVGELGERLFELLHKEQFLSLVINLIVSEKELLRRVKNKKWDTPFPLGQDNIPVAIKYTEDKFREGLLENLIQKYPKAVFLSLVNGDETMMERNIEIILNNIVMLINLDGDV